MLAGKVGLPNYQSGRLAIAKWRHKNQNTVVVAVHDPQISEDVECQVPRRTQSLGVVSANACCQVSLANHHVGGHIVCEGRAESYNSIPVGVGDPETSIWIKGGGIRIANRAGRRPTRALGPNVEAWLAQNYAGGLAVSEPRGTRPDQTAVIVTICNE